MNFEEGKKLLESILLEKCQECGGTGEINNIQTGSPRNCPTCHGSGKQLNGLADALIEFLGDHLTAFAEKEHGHHLS